MYLRTHFDNETQQNWLYKESRTLGTKRNQHFTHHDYHQSYDNTKYTHEGTNAHKLILKL